MAAQPAHKQEAGNHHYTTKKVHHAVLQLPKAEIFLRQRGHHGLRTQPVKSFSLIMFVGKIKLSLYALTGFKMIFKKIKKWYTENRSFNLYESFNLHLQGCLIEKGDKLGSQQHNHLFSQELWYKETETCRQNMKTLERDIGQQQSQKERGQKSIS